MVLIYCKQCKKAIHIKTKYRNYLPAFGKIGGRPYGIKLHINFMCSCDTEKEHFEKEHFEKEHFEKEIIQLDQNILPTSEQIIILFEEQFKILLQLKKLLLINIKISKKNRIFPSSINDGNK